MPPLPVAPGQAGDGAIDLSESEPSLVAPPRCVNGASLDSEGVASLETPLLTEEEFALLEVQRVKIDHARISCNCPPVVILEGFFDMVWDPYRPNFL